MRPRPPTMRTKRRYILARILPYGAAVDQKQLYLSVIEAAASLFGDAAVGLAQPAVVYCDAGYAVIRCRRGTERDIAAALATVTAVGDDRVSLRTVAASGTIRAPCAAAPDETYPAHSGGWGDYDRGEGLCGLPVSGSKG